jgi:hypothetical protein
MKPDKLNDVAMRELKNTAGGLYITQNKIVMIVHQK